MAVTWKQIITENDNATYLNSNVTVSDLGGGSGSTFLRKDGSWATPTDTNTTYSVGDGGLTENNLTDALKSNYDTAYGWGNHASGGYASSSHSHSYVPLSGGTMSGALNMGTQAITNWNTLQSQGNLYFDNAGAIDSRGSGDLVFRTTDSITTRLTIANAGTATFTGNIVKSGTAGWTISAGAIQAGNNNFSVSNQSSNTLQSNGRGTFGNSYNTIQLVAKANGSQTANVFEVQNSSATSKFSVDKDGNSVQSGTVTTPVMTVNGSSFIYKANGSNADLTITTSGLTTPNHGTSANWKTAYDWGNHASANYLTSETDSQTLSVSGTSLSISNGNTVTTQDTVYTHPTGAGNKHIPSGGSSGEFLKYSSSGTAVWASDNDTVYTHPTSAGNKHIPSGGSSGQFLRYNSSGTAEWATPSYTTNTDTINMGSGFRLSSTSGASTVTEDEYVKIVGATGNLGSDLTGSGTQGDPYLITLTSPDTVYTHPTSAGNKHIPSGGSSGEFLKYSSSGTAVWATPSYIPNSDTTYSAGDGLDLSGTTFSVEADLRGDTHTIGRDTNDYFSILSNSHDWYLDGVLDMRLENDGDLHVEKDVIAYSSTVASDKRLKTDISELQGNLDNVMSLEPVKFDWVLKDRGEDIGFIAQDMQKVIPEVVKEVNTIGETAEVLEGDTMLTIDYAKLVPVLVGAIQELKAEIDELKRNK